MLEELDFYAEILERHELKSVFVGGGTPSLWEPEQLGRVLERLRIGAGTEVTVECNPSSFDRTHGERLLAQGVNRVSLGVQSLDSERLAFLGRWHSPDEALLALEAALEAGLPRVSGDLIFGVAGQSAEAARDEVLRVAAVGVTHLSAYALTIEPRTVFGARAQAGSLPLLPEDTVADSFLAVHEALTQQGFDHYEISNFAKNGHTSRHNLGYWTGLDYLGLGTGAWGTLTTPEGQRFRYRNTQSVQRYLSAPIAELRGDHEPLDAETRFSERLLLGLRLRDGVDLGATSRELGLDPWTPERLRAIDRLTSQGRLTRDGDRLLIPQSRWLLADGTIAALL